MCVSLEGFLCFCEERSKNLITTHVNVDWTLVAIIALDDFHKNIFKKPVSNGRARLVSIHLSSSLKIAIKTHWKSASKQWKHSWLWCVYTCIKNKHWAYAWQRESNTSISKDKWASQFPGDACWLKSPTGEVDPNWLKGWRNRKPPTPEGQKRICSFQDVYVVLLTLFIKT